MLFRLVQPCGGMITIDGYDTAKMGLRTLRRALSIIPQDPVMCAPPPATSLAVHHPSLHGIP